MVTNHKRSVALGSAMSGNAAIDQRLPKIAILFT